MVDDSGTRTRATAGDETADGTLAPAPPSAPTHVATHELTLVPTVGAAELVALPDPGYQLGDVIGRGGMGEVVAAQDQRIGREVAIKRIRGKASSDLVDRFLREARIQARLDHPAIVPVYELGTDAEGAPYFTMKRLTGVTLSKKLTEKPNVQPLLRAFADVCLAIELAHSRGVIHRDLKPSNIMLGDFGEVYVLDWGVARVIADSTRAPVRTSVPVGDDADHTTIGSILGTPGYMSPEQVRGGEAEAPADVYSLGAILFEILAGEPLHPRGEAALATTLTQPQVAPASRSAERAIAPELDSACFDALAEDPVKRPSARALAQRIQAYLDGDRDHERRRQLAKEQLEAAREALASTSDTSRATAMRRAARAMALDPDSNEAAVLVTKLTVEPPETLPPALVASLAAEDMELDKDRSRRGLRAYFAVFCFISLIPLLHVTNWGLVIAAWILVALLGLIMWGGSRTGQARLYPALTVNLAAVFVFSRILGPFIITPVATVGILFSFTASPRLLQRRWVIVLWATIAVMAPVVCELLGVLPRTWWIENGAIVSTSQIFEVGGLSTAIGLILANAGWIAIVSVYAIGTNIRRRKAQRELQIQRWHLQQAIPATQSSRLGTTGLRPTWDK